MLPASAFMLFRPTVAPARPCRVPSEVSEFMAPALELAVVPAAGREERKKREGGREEKEGERWGGGTQTCYTTSEETSRFLLLQFSLGLNTRCYMCSAAVKRATLRLLIGETCRTQSPSFQHESKMFDDKEAEVEIRIV